MKHIHIVNPYNSVAMMRLTLPLMKEFPAIHVLSHSATVNEEADLNYHVPWHTLIGYEGAGKQAMLYTHCNPPDVASLQDACSRADLIVCMSFTGRQELLDIGADPLKLWVVYAAAANLFQYRRRTIGVVGFTQPNGRKRESILIDLAWRYDLTPYHFVIAGEGWDETVRVLQSLGVSVECIGPVNDEELRALYRRLDVLLVTGFAEGGPLPVLEALASGTPVLSPPFGYAADFLPEERLYNTVEELAERLDDLSSASMQDHFLIRSWSWEDYAAEHALIFGRLLNDNVELFPPRAAARYAQLLDIIDEIKPRSIVEIGTWNGKRAVQMIQAASKHSVVSYQGFDLFDEQTKEQVRGELSKNSWPLAIVKRRLQSTSVKISLVPGNTNETLELSLGVADLYFIDGGHSEDTIKNDWFWVEKHMDADSVVVFDDYYYKGKPQGMGCNQVVEGLNCDYFEVIRLPEITINKDGLEIGMIKVKKNAPISVQVSERTYGNAAAYNAVCAVSDMLQMPEADVESTAIDSGELERATATLGNGSQSGNYAIDRNG